MTSSREARPGARTMTTRGAAGLCAALVICWLPVLVDASAVTKVAGLYALADSPHPYLVPAHFWLLYVWSPLVAVSACVLVLSPGLLLAIATDSARGVGMWMLSALVLNLVVISPTAAVLQSLTAISLRGGPFLLVVGACSVACFGALLWRTSRGAAAAWPLAGPATLVALLTYVVVPLGLLVALTPKFYWDNFNGDGVHAYESARLLLRQPLPFFDPTAGTIAAFPGVSSMLFAYPTSWFIRMFGEVEVSARLPLLLYLVALHGAVVALAEDGQRRTLGPFEHWLIWLQIAVYAIVMTFSASYSPYSADIALPATQDTLAMVCFMGFVLAFVRRAGVWTAVFVVLTYLSLPNGTLLLGFWLAAVWLLWRPRPSPAIVTTAAALLACLIMSALLPRLLILVHLPPPGSEYAAGELLRRFAFLQLADWRRFAFMVVPCGILPAAALAGWPWHDQVSRAVTAVALAYFAFFYVQSRISLHHFVPAMVLPLVVFWRSPLLLRSGLRALALAGAAVTGVLALTVSLPTHAMPHTTARQVGSTIDVRVGNYDRSDPAAFRSAELLRYLFPPSWDPHVPSKSYGGSPLVWNYYAHRADRDPSDVNYVLQPAGDPAPAASRLVAAEGGFALFVHSDAVWTAHRALQPATPPGSPVYLVPPATLYGAGDAPIDLTEIASRLGVDLHALRERLAPKQQKE